jgi:hypothetical protein
MNTQRERTKKSERKCTMIMKGASGRKLSMSQKIIIIIKYPIPPTTYVNV